MDLPPFLLDEWISRFDFAVPPIACNLASSTGPRWTLEAVLALSEPALRLNDVGLGHAPAAGSPALREAIAAFHGADPAWVVVTTGASEALSLLFCIFETSGANIVLPEPGYPPYAAIAAAWRLAVSAGTRRSLCPARRGGARGHHRPHRRGDRQHAAQSDRVGDETHRA